jgi:23S rRNA (guanosine2251-2'-O)-methyltransferase
MRPRFTERKKQSDASQAEDWIYGVNPVLEALAAGRNVKTLYISAARHDRVGQILGEARMRGIPIETPDLSFFESRFPKGHQGVAARVVPKGYVGLDDLLVIPSERGEVALFLVLDSIEDPRNFGAILRSADASGVHGVVIQAYRAAGVGPQVSKSSAGAVEHVPVSVVPNIKHAIRRMKDEGITVIGAEADATTALWDADLSIPLCIVIGSEGKGMRMTVKEQCDLVVGLPMKGKINSLNVSVASGVILFEVFRQRFAKTGTIPDSGEHCNDNKSFS